MLVCKLSTWIEPHSRGNLSFCHEEKLYPEELEKYDFDYYGDL